MGEQLLQAQKDDASKVLEDDTDAEKEETPESTIKETDREEKPAKTSESDSNKVDSWGFPITNDGETEFNNEIDNTEEKESVANAKDLPPMDAEAHVTKTALMQEKLPEAAKVENEDNGSNLPAETLSMTKETSEIDAEDIDVVEKLRKVVSELEQNSLDESNDAEQEKQLREITSNTDSKMVEEVTEEKIEVQTEVRKEYGSMGMLGASITYAYSK